MTPEEYRDRFPPSPGVLAFAADLAKVFPLHDQPGRRDAERAEWMRDDSAECSRDDADELADIARMTAAGEPPEVAADKARKSRKDAMTKRRNDARRGRSATDAAAERQNEIDRADAQARADGVASAFGEQSPPPMSGELAFDYRKRLLRRFQKHSPDFKEIDLHTINDSTLLSGIETRVYADAAAVAKSPAFLNASDDIVYRTRIDPNSGHRITEGFGKHTIFSLYAMPAMRVTKFMVPGHNAN